MFRNRQSSQKPPDELFERFRLSFPDVTSTAGEQPVTNGNGIHDPIISQTARFGHEDLDPTPRAAAEPFRFTPSLLDPTSAAFAAFANQPPGYYTPTPGNPQPPQFNEHSVDLQTPNIGIGIGPPITATTGPLMNGNVAYTAHAAINPQQFQNYHPFLAPPLHPEYNMHSFDAPASPKGSPMEISKHEEDIPSEYKQLFGTADGVEMRQHIPHPGIDQFRFHVTLTAPTAMIRHPDEIPITYLNKGQTYTMTIVDTSPSHPTTSDPVRYRTFIRVSFQDEGQRQRAATCWQLWKEGRGTNEAHQRGGKLQAVEYVASTALNGEDEKKRCHIDLDSSSFDGFSVIWTPPHGVYETVVSVRFNFLSTDFSHSKGVKGIPVRLCAKTEMLPAGDSPRQPAAGQPEVCYCKVKLFRDHGAERKLANDVLHVKKTMDKLKQQADAPDDSAGSKRRKDSIASNKSSSALEGGKPGKAAKHKRTWSISSASSTGVKPDDDIAQKIAALQDMFTSTRPVSVLYLRGEERDDPDLYPIHLPGEPGAQDSGMDENWMRRPSAASMISSASASSFVSPSPSSASLPNDFPTTNGTDHDNFRSVNGRFGSTEVTRIKTGSSDAGILAGWIEAIGIDPSYVPPVDRQPKAVMCIYVLPNVIGGEQIYHKAVYLRERTESCLSAQIAHKCGVDASQIRSAIRVDSRGLHSIIDDEVVREMKEGQDMKVQFVDMNKVLLSPPQTEWGPDVGDDAMVTGKDIFADKGLEMRLFF
ncbi:hypothetical protein Dda_4611 [Drechslerella dactyloides]|uniref:Grh/CP2 DB domain-containing protein n=1 Tax=Drechslerella dactyloides TaxID=74499 RepID=A0AAD6IZG8_DREDA|nr:hypothetical protein Dda_4611 [Drechslerella dactyloides]